MLRDHEDKVILHSMAAQIDRLEARSIKLEQFNSELVNVVRKLCEHQENMMKEISKKNCKCATPENNTNIVSEEKDVKTKIIKKSFAPIVTKDSKSKNKDLSKK